MGITAAITGGLEALGVGTSTAGILGGVGAGALEGAGIGAGTAALTGGKPLKGAEFGALTGGVGGAVAPALSAIAPATFPAGGALTDALAGAAGGAVAGGVTGQNPLTSALEGGAAGGLSSLLPSGGPLGGGGAGPVAASGGPITPIGSDQISAEIPGGSTSLTTPSQIDSQIPGGAVPAAAAPATGVAAPGGGTTLSKALGGGGGGGLLRDALAGGGLALAAGRSKAKLPGEAPLTALATTQGTQGQQLESYLTTGTLPPGVQAGIDQAKESAKATIRSQYAAMGMSGSTSEQAALAQADTAAVTQGASIATNLLNSGMAESRLSGELYQQILATALGKDQALGSAIGNFSTALAGGNPLQQKAA